MNSEFTHWTLFLQSFCSLHQSEHFVLDRPLTSMPCSTTISLLSLVWCCKSRQRIAILENARTLCTALGACNDQWSVKFNVNCEPALDVILVRAVTLTGSAKIRWATFPSQIFPSHIFPSQIFHSHLSFIFFIFLICHSHWPRQADLKFVATVATGGRVKFLSAV